MKKIAFIAIIAAIAATAACKKIKQLANINVDIPYNPTITVPQAQGYPEGTPLPFGGLSLPFPVIPVATNSKDYIDQYHTSTDKITSVDLKSLALQLSPADKNFDFLDSVQVFLSAPSEPEVLIAYQYNVPKNSNSLQLTTVPSVNLKDYFIKDTIYFRMGAHINATPPTGTQMNVSSVFHMVANPLN